MPWLKLDDAFASHPKIAGLPDAAFRLHVTALCHAVTHLTNGQVSDKTLTKICQSAHPRRVASRLVDAGLWEPNGAGWVIHDFLDYQPERATVLAQRKANLTRQNRWRNASRNASRNAPTNGAPSLSLSEKESDDASRRSSSLSVDPAPWETAPGIEPIPMAESAQQARQLRERLQ